MSGSVDMNVMHVSQFYPCSKVTLASELYYICELGKYLKCSYDTHLSLNGVVLSKVLKESIIWDYFRIAIESSWVIDTGLSLSEVEFSPISPLTLEVDSVKNVLYTTEEVVFDKDDEAKRRNDVEYAIKTPKKLQVSFTKQTQAYWLWDMNGKDGQNFYINSKSLNTGGAMFSWVSLIAYVAVERVMHGEPELLCLSFGDSVVMGDKALAYFLMLCDESNCLHGWVKYTFEPNVTQESILNLGYVSWYVKGKDMGFKTEWYSPKQKLNRMKELDIAVGDVVCLFERHSTQRLNYLKNIANCHMAVIQSIDQRGITFCVINTMKTRAQGKADFDDKTMIVKKMYTTSLPYENINSTVRTIDLPDLGVEYCLYSECFFIVPLSETSDEKITLVSRSGEKPVLVKLDQNNFIYWVFKEYNVEFNEDRFRSKYFSKDEPAFDVFMRGDELDESFYNVEG